MISSIVSPAALRAGLTALCSGSLLSLAAIAMPVQAQVRLSPLVIEEQAVRGQAQGVLNISNNTNEPFRARLYVAPFTYDDDEGFQYLESDSSDLSPYLQFSPRELQVPPNTTRRIRFVSRFPPSMPEQEYRAVLVTENLREIASGDGIQVIVQAQVGATVYIRNGDLAANLAAVNASFDPSNNQLGLLVQNTGPASARPKVFWALSQGGREVYSGETGETTVITGSDRRITLNSPSGQNRAMPALAGSGYQLSGELVWENEDDVITRQPFDVEVTLTPER